jgi:hypothetical protein
MATKVDFVRAVLCAYAAERSEEAVLRYIIGKTLQRADLEFGERTFSLENPPAIRDVVDVVSRIPTDYHEQFIDALSELRRKLMDVPLVEAAARLRSLSDSVVQIETKLNDIHAEVGKGDGKQDSIYNQLLARKREFLLQMDKMSETLTMDVPLDVDYNNVHSIAGGMAKSIGRMINANLLPPILVENYLELIEKWTESPRPVA